MAHVRIFITDLAAYNAGHLIGEWVDLPTPADQLQATIDAILSEGAKFCNDGKHEEIFLTDWETEDIPLEIDEHSDPHEINEQAQRFEELDDDEKIAVEAAMDAGYSFDEAIEKADEVTIYYAGGYEDLAEQFVDDGLFGDIPDSIINYIDYEKIGRDLRFDYSHLRDDIFYRID